MGRAGVVQGLFQGDGACRSSPLGARRWQPVWLGPSPIQEVAPDVGTGAQGLRLPFPVPTPAHAELVPERELAQLGQG